ncbi:MAG: S1 RNA-binding domain-containing protein [Clostridia bacterium]|nr:S1 RNA-binding domain-containing protein [Clostridia bacterium]
MELKVGQIVDAKITGITAFGVFVDIGEGKSGLVHISEVSRTYIDDLNEVVKIGDAVKAKIMNIGEDGKISLSIKRASEPEKREAKVPRERRERPPVTSQKPDNSFVWTPKKTESASFEEMMSRFKQASDEKFSDLKRKNPEAKRSKRGAFK